MLVPVPNTEPNEANVTRATSVNGNDPAASRQRTAGLGRVLITVYLILALAATLRAVYQLISKFDEAPLAYSLSLASGLVYVVATVALLKRGSGALWRKIAWWALGFELAGVLLVGTLSLVLPTWFAHDSVWSYFGSGYLFIPLVLPVLGMVWLCRDAAYAESQSSEAVRGSLDADESLY